MNAGVEATGAGEGSTLVAQEVRELVQRSAEAAKLRELISQVRVEGFSDREVAVELDQATLERFGLEVTDIGAALARHSLDMPAGTLEGPAGDAATAVPCLQRHSL